MHAVAIPRFEPGAGGIHLIWTWPDVLPLSVHGYDIQRRDFVERHYRERCETIDRLIIDILRARAEYPAPLGPLRMSQGASFKPIMDAALFPPVGKTSSGHPQGFGDPKIEDVYASIAVALRAAPLTQNAVAAGLDIFIQELSVPTDRAIVTAQARVAISMGISGGKVVAVAPGTTIPITMQLNAPSMDTIVIYVLSPLSLQICVFDPPDPKIDDAEWSQAPYIVKGLTLPIHEADPSLAVGTAEYSAAKARLVGGEALTQSDFNRMIPAMRLAVAANDLGRNGERIVLVRSAADQSYEELAFEAQLTALTLHPKARRILGFGFADRRGLMPGHTYVYRITGRFRAEDLYDDIYDVHLAPTATPLPTAFTIRDLGVRFQTPVKIVLDPEPSNSALYAVSRRGIRIDTTAFNASWITPDFGIWSAIFDFPRPVTDVVLEVAPDHSFTYAGGNMWAFGAVPAIPLPPGPRAALHFATPITQLRLAGTGTLFALRLPSGKSGIVEIHAETEPVAYAPQPLPVPPIVFTAYNLQEPPSVLTGSIDESTKIPTRPPSGFKLNWLPAVFGGIALWPDDLAGAPPLDAFAYQIEHRRVDPPATFGPWEPIQSGDNLAIGSRDMTEPTVRLEEGMDFDQVYPRIRPRLPGVGFALHLSDIFGERDPTTNTVRPEQPLGTYHQYQIRAMDAVGRVSPTWTPSNIARLEKRIPPPLPVGPQPAGAGTEPVPPPVDAQNHLIAPPGPKARAIVAGARGLTADDLTLLGTHQNVILLEWGWRQHERDLDPTTTEFRIYTSRPPDIVSGMITSVTSASPNWQLAFTSDVPLVADECVGQWITSGGYPFRIAHNEAGTTPQIVVEPAQAQPAAIPVPGPVVFGRPLQPEHQRPAGWGSRVAAIPLTAEQNYHYIFYDILTLDPAHPRDSVWVGVSAADSQSYVGDELATGPNAPRPGNESSIAACSVSAHYQGQPEFSVPPPLGDVPELVTEEPTGRQVLVPLDLTVLLGGALPAGSPVALERCSSDDIISRLSVNGGGNIVLANPDGTTQTIAFPNPGDEATVLATLNSSDPQRLASRYLLYLLVNATHPEAFFQRTSGQTELVGVASDRLAPKPGRFFYRVRAADALGHVSDGGAILPIVVRVPSTASAATPLRQSLIANDTGATLTVAVPADPDTTHVLLFASVTPPGIAPQSQVDAELLRIPNRRDLYPRDGLRLRLADGTLLAPLIAKDLSDPDVTIDGNGQHVVSLTVPATRRSWIALWSYGLTRDGFPSFPCGPFGIGVSS